MLIDTKSNQKNLCVLKNFSITSNASGRKAAAIPSVPYAIHTTINPQNIKETLLISAPCLLTANSRNNKYVKIPASSGCNNIRILQEKETGIEKKV
jgi:hypothetical protein